MPGEIDPNSDPPTDAQTDGVSRAGMAWLGEQAAARRDVEMRLRAPKAATFTETSMWVQPLDGITVLDFSGVPYPTAGTWVPINDVYAHRRIRDGSLLLAEVPTAWALLTADETGTDTFAAHY